MYQWKEPSTNFLVWFSNPFWKWNWTGSEHCKEAELLWQKQTGQGEGPSPTCSFYLLMACGLFKMEHHLETCDLAQYLHCSSRETEINKWKWLVGIHTGRVETSSKVPCAHSHPFSANIPGTPRFLFMFSSPFHCFRSFLFPWATARLPHLLAESLSRPLKSTNILSLELSVSMPPNIASHYLLMALTYDGEVREPMWILPFL